MKKDQGRFNLRTGKYLEWRVLISCLSRFILLHLAWLVSWLLPLVLDSFCHHISPQPFPHITRLTNRMKKTIPVAVESQCFPSLFTQPLTPVMKKDVSDDDVTSERYEMQWRTLCYTFPFPTFLYAARSRMQRLTVRNRRLTVGSLARFIPVRRDMWGRKDKGWDW